MGLVEQFTRFFQRQDVTPAKTTSDEIDRRRHRVYDDFAAQFRTAGDRRSLIELSRRMYAQDPRIEGAILTMGRDATKGGFSVTVDGPGADRAAEVADDLMRRLKLATVVDNWFRLTLRDGDSFLELGVDGQRQIVDVTRKPTLEMHRHTDKFDRWIYGPARAFWWSEELMGYALQPGADAIWFPAWMIIHARWQFDGDDRYGKPLFSASAKSFKRVEEGELDVAVRRKTRAGMRYSHVLEGADATAIEEYRNINAAALDNKSAAVADFFSNVKGGIEAIQGDARLSEIDDVMHHIETMFIASPVPLTLLGYGKDLNRDILQQKQEQYDRALESVSGWVVDELVEPLLTRQWLLAGIWPNGLEYKITQSYRPPVTPTEIVAVAEALIKMRGTGLFSDDMLIEIGARMLPDIDAERAKTELAAAMAAQPDEVGRMGSIVGNSSDNNQG